MRLSLMVVTEHVVRKVNQGQSNWRKPPEALGAQTLPEVALCKENCTRETHMELESEVVLGLHFARETFQAKSSWNCKRYQH